MITSVWPPQRDHGTNGAERRRRAYERPFRRRGGRSDRARPVGATTARSATRRWWRTAAGSSRSSPSALPTSSAPPAPRATWSATTSTVPSTQPPLRLPKAILGPRQTPRHEHRAVLTPSSCAPPHAASYNVSGTLGVATEREQLMTGARAPSNAEPVHFAIQTLCAKEWQPGPKTQDRYVIPGGGAIDSEVAETADWLSDRILSVSQQRQPEGGEWVSAGGPPWTVAVHLARQLDEACKYSYEIRVVAALAASTAPTLILQARNAEAADTDVLRRFQPPPRLPSVSVRRRMVVVSMLRDKVDEIGGAFSGVALPVEPGAPAHVVPPEQVARATKDLLDLLDRLAAHPLTSDPRLDRIRALADRLADAHEAVSGRTGHGEAAEYYAERVVAAAAATAALFVAIVTPRPIA